MYTYIPIYIKRRVHGGRDEYPKSDVGARLVFALPRPRCGVPHAQTVPDLGFRVLKTI